VLSAINEESSTLPALLTDYILNGKNDHQEPMVFLEHRVVLRATTTTTIATVAMQAPTFLFSSYRAKGELPSSHPPPLPPLLSLYKQAL